MGLFEVLLRIFLITCSVYQHFFPDIPKIEYRTIQGHENLKIVQLSDLHFESNWYYNGLPRTILHDTIIKVNALEPDLIFLTGDFVDFDKDSIHELCTYLRKLKAKKGIFAVAGNHDAKNPQESPKYILDSLKEINFHVLANETYKMDNIEIVGTHDRYNPEFNKFKLLKLDESCTTRFVLSHNPNSYNDFVNHGWKFDMLFSGHSHNGQICLPNGEPILKYIREIIKYMPWVPRKIITWATIIDWNLKASNLHINRGLGSHPPGRIWCSPEITMMEMERSVALLPIPTIKISTLV